MSKIDELRFKEQKNLWVVEVGSLLLKYGNNVEKFREEISNISIKQGETDEAIKKYQENYHHMLQVASTADLYKDTIDNGYHKACSYRPTDDVVAGIPESCRTIMARPRRPSTSYLLFVLDNRERYEKLKSEKSLNQNAREYFTAQWAQLGESEKNYYKEKYASLLEDYKKAMKEYMANMKDNYLERAMKERTKSSKSLRRKLREFSLTPVNVRNSFNFFVHENAKEVTGLAKSWKNLTAEERKKYHDLHKRDAERYQKEKQTYDELNKMLSLLLKQKNTQKDNK